MATIEACKRELTDKRFAEAQEIDSFKKKIEGVNDDTLLVMDFLTIGGGFIVYKQVVIERDGKVSSENLPFLQPVTKWSDIEKDVKVQADQFISSISTQLEVPHELVWDAAIIARTLAENYYSHACRRESWRTFCTTGWNLWQGGRQSPHQG